MVKFHFSLGTWAVIPNQSFIHNLPDGKAELPGKWRGVGQVGERGEGREEEGVRAICKVLLQQNQYDLIYLI